MRALLAVGIGMGLLVGTAMVNVSAEDALTKRDRQGPVTVAITLVPPLSPGSPVRLRVVLDTHSVGLDGIAFEQAVARRTPGGRDEAPAAVEQVSGTGHNREAVVVFESLENTSDVQIVVRGIGRIPERVFAWQVPVAR